MRIAYNDALSYIGYERAYFLIYFGTEIMTAYDVYEVSLWAIWLFLILSWVALFILALSDDLRK